MLAHRRHAGSLSWPRTSSPLPFASCQPAGVPWAMTTDAEPIMGVVGRSSTGRASRRLTRWRVLGTTCLVLRGVMVEHTHIGLVDVAETRPGEARDTDEADTTS